MFPITGVDVVCSAQPVIERMFQPVLGALGDHQTVFGAAIQQLGVVELEGIVGGLPHKAQQECSVLLGVRIRQSGVQTLFSLSVISGQNAIAALGVHQTGKELVKLRKIRIQSVVFQQVVFDVLKVVQHIAGRCGSFSAGGVQHRIQFIVQTGVCLDVPDLVTQAFLPISGVLVVEENRLERGHIHVCFQAQFQRFGDFVVENAPAGGGEFLIDVEPHLAVHKGDVRFSFLALLLNQGVFLQLFQIAQQFHGVLFMDHGKGIERGEIVKDGNRVQQRTCGGGQSI